MIRYITADRLCIFFLKIFFVLYLLIATLTTPTGWGELTSFEIPIISLVEHGSFEARESDYQLALQYFAPHKNVLEFQYKVFPMDGEGHRYPWYFGLYAPLCVPFFLLLKTLHLNTAYTLPVVNALCLSVALWGIYRYWNTDVKNKLFAILFFGVGELSLWAEITTESYEVAMTSMVIMATVFWLNRDRKRAAFFLSLAGTMNPTVMAVGIFMIADYFCEIFVSSGKSWGLFAETCKKQWKDLLRYAVCFFPCLLPMAYSYNLFGSIVTMYGVGTSENLWKRFLAYIVDLNFGLFPYIPILFPLFVYICFKSKNTWMKWTFLGIVATIFSYSLVFHINCGMPSIHRYNEWLLPLIVLPTIAQLHSVFPAALSRNILWGIEAGSLLWCGCIMGISFHTHYCSWLPLARAVLDYAPQLYNPLPSTFNSRTSHIDGGYAIKEPVIYTAKDGYVRKVLIPPGMAEQACAALYVPPEAEQLFYRQYEQAAFADDYRYLNFSRDAHVLSAATYTLGNEVLFDGSQQDGHRYFTHGLSHTEKDFVWTDGKEARFRACLSEPVRQGLLLSLRIGGVFYRPQRLIVSCGGQVIFDQAISNRSQIVDIPIPKECVLGGKIVDILFEFPDAVAPSRVMESQDRRELALALQSFSISLLKRGERL